MINRCRRLRRAPCALRVMLLFRAERGLVWRVRLSDKRACSSHAKPLLGDETLWRARAESLRDYWSFSIVTEAFTFACVPPTIDASGNATAEE
jgi:hypothetical protein